MIKRVKIEGLHRSETFAGVSFDQKFNNDVNILTGKNGAGKTSILRLMWYATSLNIERMFDDANFDIFEIYTTDYDLKISRHKVTNRELIEEDRIRIEFIYKSELTSYDVLDKDYSDFADKINGYLHQNNARPHTVMFPTFRRIEGGFSYLSARKNKLSRHELQVREPIENGLDNMSKMLGVGSHTFVASISTQDIKLLLTSSYAEASKKNNQDHIELSKKVRAVFAKNDNSSEVRNAIIANEMLETIRLEMDKATKSQEENMKPFNVAAAVIKSVFKEKAIKINDSIAFGENSWMLDSDQLSSGEKQFLSFVCYNAIFSHRVFFIDEPELSLHPDWQRKLLPILNNQNATNQLFIATHSPYILAKYQDKEFEVKR